MSDQRSDSHRHHVPQDLVPGDHGPEDHGPQDHGPQDHGPGDLAEFLELAADQSWPAEPEQLAQPKSYRFALGQQPIELGQVEFRILLFLASRPYHAFTARAIAEAVSSEREPVTEASLGKHVSSLRDQLGVFFDYVQTVPYIGYRFKE